MNSMTFRQVNAKKKKHYFVLVDDVKEEALIITGKNQI